MSIPSKSAETVPFSEVHCCGREGSAARLLSDLSGTSSRVVGWSSGLFMLKEERLPRLKVNVFVSDCLLKFSKRGCDSRGQAWGEVTTLGRSPADGGLQFFFACMPALEFGGLLLGSVTYSK